jgi:hypothetical protein
LVTKKAVNLTIRNRQCIFNYFWAKITLINLKITL